MAEPIKPVDLTGRPPLHDAILDRPPVTSLEEIADELGELVAKDVSLPVPARPGWEVVYSAAVDGQRLSAMRRACKDESQDTGVNEYEWAASILAVQCVRMVRNDKTVVDSTGAPLTFRSGELHTMLRIPSGAPSSATLAVKKFLGGDGIVQTTSVALFKAAGWQEDIAPNPTFGPSTGS